MSCRTLYGYPRGISI
ncbi:hypothetical protein F3H64_12800 [Enterobacter hormaechei]|nr:hypothetical protein EYC85_18130 [Enterobacter hormaechei]KAA0867360.1 hypothetical protein EYC91_16735 [Enterobacter hormaechei]KAA0902820.1 hypothetical protein EVS72_10425 [Enterobacter hormaechei]KAA0906830.1 hypothetical protein EYC88_13070 [Enterobacter hormaechei]MBE8857601.1 hypothetical protein [Enterobacter hormaechei]